MKIEEDKLTKLYYTIGEVAGMFDVNTSLIRFWEKEFDAIKPKKNKKGNRLFSPKDILNINKIYELVKINGYTLEGAKKTLKSKPEDQVDSVLPSNELLIKKLESIRLKLIGLKGSSF